MTDPIRQIVCMSLAGLLLSFITAARIIQRRERTGEGILTGWLLPSGCLLLRLMRWRPRLPSRLDAQLRYLYPGLGKTELASQYAAERIGQCLFVLTVALAVFAFLPAEALKNENGILALILFVSAVAAVIVLGRVEVKQKVKKRKEAIQRAYPQLLQKLSIFLGAGLSLSEAWTRAALQSREKEPLTEEMNRVRVRMANGLPIQDALREFASRNHDGKLRRLVNLLIRDMRRGNDYLLDSLMEMNREAWEERRKRVRVRSEEASTKLLLPLLIMLCVVLLIVMAPALLSMSQPV